MNKKRKKRKYKLTPIGKLVVFGFPVLLIAGLAVVLFTIANAEKVNKKVEIEAGAAFPPIESFLINPEKGGSFVTNISTIDLKKPGHYRITIKVGKKEYESTLVIEDTIKPVVTTRSLTLWNGQEVKPEDFVESIDDVTRTLVTFVTKPDYGKVGEEQTITLKVTDEGGNETLANATVITDTDFSAPVMIGVADKAVYTGQTVSYKKNVTLLDDKDENPVLTIDNSAVDLDVPGEYEVIYTVTDAAGNSTSQTVIFTVLKDDGNGIDEDTVDALADKVLGEIIRDDMSELEKAKAIYDWVKDNVTYKQSDEKIDWVKAAYIAFTKKTGDCYMFFSVTQELLTRAGIQNMKVERDTDAIKTRHYWNLVNVGTGWYHLDTCPHIRGAKFESFMKTDAELEAYTNKFPDNKEIYYYYTFDKSKYPDRAETIIEE
ncbi:MAG: hypothetical protein E7266_02665 [Lachnospiraceae bacterium]|nr:hypothetical protein [Lachnospiraceae bacterium]